MKKRHINLEYLEEISGGDNYMILEMIGIFNSEVPEYLSMMNEYIDRRDWDALGKLAHKVKASASIMGLSELTTELNHLEICAKEKQSPDICLSHARNIEKQFSCAIEELKSISKNLKKK